MMGKEISSIVESHSVGSALASLASGWLPGVGATIATVAGAGFIWSMYYRINEKLGIPFKKNVVKSLATAIGTNLVVYAASAVGAVVLSTALSFLPGIGNFAASAIMAGFGFVVAWTSGLVYVKVLSRFAHAKADFNNITEAELKSAAEDVIAHEDIKGMMKEAKSQFRKAKDRGDIRKGAPSVKPLEDDE